MKHVLCFLCLLLLGSNIIRAQEAESRDKAAVMWGLSGVLPRDRAHWIRNFDYFQLIPGVAAMPMDVIPEDPLGRFQPDDLRQLAFLSDEAGCRFFFVVEVSSLNEQVQGSKEGKRTNYQQRFRQPVTLTAYRKAPGQERWEKLQPVSGSAKDKDMVGTSDVPEEERKQKMNQQRCKFLRKVPAQTAAELVGRALVEVKCRIRVQGPNAPVLLEYMLVNHSPLKLSTIYLELPEQNHDGELRTQSLLHGKDLSQVRILEPYETSPSSLTFELEEGWKPLVTNVRVRIEGWSQEELDAKQSRRKGLQIHRTEWQEHENLPPPAHEMNWETEEGK
jgi:hypothetical protein